MKKKRWRFSRVKLKTLAGTAQTDGFQNIKAKAEYVTEICYRFTDQETKETGYYNKGRQIG